MKLKPENIFLLVVAAIVVLVGAARWYFTKHHWPDCLRPREWFTHRVYVTNYVNPESLVLPHGYVTNYTLCISTGYCHWVFFVTNWSDTAEIRSAYP